MTPGKSPGRNTEIIPKRWSIRVISGKALSFLELTHNHGGYMFFTLLIVAAILGFFLGPVWLIFFAMLAVLTKLFPAVIVLAVVGCAVALVFNYFKRKY